MCSEKYKVRHLISFWAMVKEWLSYWAGNNRPVPDTKRGRGEATETGSVVAWPRQRRLLSSQPASLASGTGRLRSDRGGLRRFLDGQLLLAH